MIKIAPSQIVTVIIKAIKFGSEKEQAALDYVAERLSYVFAVKHILTAPYVNIDNYLRSKLDEYKIKQQPIKAHFMIVLLYNHQENFPHIAVNVPVVFFNIKTNDEDIDTKHMMKQIEKIKKEIISRIETQTAILEYFVPEQEIKMIDSHVFKILDALTYNLPSRKEERIMIKFKKIDAGTLYQLQNTLFSYSQQPVWIVLTQSDPTPIVKQLVSKGQMVFVPSSIEEFVNLIEEYSRYLIIYDKTDTLKMWEQQLKNIGYQLRYERLVEFGQVSEL